MKRTVKFLLSFVLVISLFYPLSSSETEAAFKYKKGDILITDTTSSKGVLGHSAIYIGDNKVLHTSGWKKEPYPTIMSLKNWTKRYKERVKVVRYNDSKKAEKAADMAVKYFKDKKIKYKVTENPKDIDPNTYCSELVWYSYYKAGVTFKVPVASIKGWRVPDIIKPNDYLFKSSVEHNKFKIVDNKY